MISRMVAVVLLMILPMAGPEKGGKPTLLEPNPSLTPERVVEIQVEALQKNDLPTLDAGIATTFRFASPGNRVVTGPLANFTLIVKSPGYKPMINHKLAGYGPLRKIGNQASQRVTIIAAGGQAIEYEFRLSKDADSGCWYTDGVIVVPELVDDGKVA